MGSFGVGKLFFINIVIIVLIGENKFYVDVGFGNKYNIIRIYRYVIYEMRCLIEKRSKWFKKNEFLWYRLCDNNELRYEM